MKRNGIAIEITVALIALLSSIITVVFDKESHGAITHFYYMDFNATAQDKCLKSSEIMLK